MTTAKKPMSRDEVVAATIAMRRHGGVFVRALAQAWAFADDANRARIETAFADLLAEYRAVAQRRAA